MYEFALAQVSEPTSSCFISLSLSQNCQEKNLKKCDMTVVNSPVLSAWGSLTANPKCSHHRPEKELSTEEGGEHTQWLVVMFHGGHHKYIRSLIFYALKDLGKKLLTLKKKNLPGTCFYHVASLLLLISVGEQTGGKTATLTPPSLPHHVGSSSLTVEVYSLSYI